MKWIANGCLWVYLFICLNWARIEHFFITWAFYRTLGGWHLPSLETKEFCMINPCKIMAYYSLKCLLVDIHWFGKDWTSLFHSSILSNTWRVSFFKLSNEKNLCVQSLPNQGISFNNPRGIQKKQMGMQFHQKNRKIQEKSVKLGKLTSCWEWRNERCLSGSSITLSCGAS